MIFLEKKQLRELLLSRLKKQPIIEKKRIERELTEQLIGSPLWNRANMIGITISQSLEWNTKIIIKTAWEQGKVICVPKTNPLNYKLVFYVINSFEDVENAYYGLLEPIIDQTIPVKKEEIDLMIVPGVVFDSFGFRIGFGGGYYDRFLTDFRNETCSLVSIQQLVEKLPNESHDVPVNYLVTEKGIQKRKT